MMDKSIEDLVKEIRAIVMDRRERQADLEIQKLYMKDDMIQKLYSSKK